MTPYYRRIVGIDMAVDRRSIAIARASYSDAQATFVIDELVLGAALSPPDVDDRLVETVLTMGPAIAERIAGPTLLAMDAPLGWPTTLARVLAEHQAGQPLALEVRQRDRMFVRRTDREITERFGRAGISVRPLEVGADRIARTAQAALALLHAASPHASVLWPDRLPPLVGIVETYPAATLAALRGSRARGYKGPRGREARAILFDTLMELSGPGEHRIEAELRSPCVDSDHALDAVVCAMGGVDVALGRARAPTSIDDELRREGWIWVRDP